MPIPQKPDDYADWAVDPQVNPISGQNNFEKPPAGEIQFGWQYLQKPPRQWFNWWQRTAGQWVRWLEYRATREPVVDAGASGVTLSGTDDAIQVFTPSANITVKLDNTFESGQSVTVVNKSSVYTITVTANDDTHITFINKLSSGEIKALADTPAVNTSWSRIVAGPPIYSSSVYFTSSGSFAKASYPGLQAIRVRAQGGGGAGGGASGGGTGGGGGAGGYAERFITDIAGLSASETITIGAGGAGSSGASGAAGGNTTAFGMTCSGGAGGVGKSADNTPSNGGNGGDATGGDINIPGSGGGWGVFVLSTGGSTGAGGASFLGHGGRGLCNEGTSGANAGPTAGTGYGAGGGGSISTGGGRAGGAGSTGVVIVDLFY